MTLVVIISIQQCKQSSTKLMMTAESLLSKRPVLRIAPVLFLRARSLYLLACLKLLRLSDLSFFRVKILFCHLTAQMAEW